MKRSCRGAGCRVQRCIGARVQRCRGGEVEFLFFMWSRGAEVERPRGLECRDAEVHC